MIVMMRGKTRLSESRREGARKEVIGRVVEMEGQRRGREREHELEGAVTGRVCVSRVGREGQDREAPVSPLGDVLYLGHRRRNSSAAPHCPPRRGLPRWRGWDLSATCG